MLPAPDRDRPAPPDHPATRRRGRFDPLAIAARRLLGDLAPVAQERPLAAMRFGLALEEIRLLRPVAEKELIALLVDHRDYRRLGLALWEWVGRP